ncbi:MAG: phosphomethylpyrimidine synthase ThiC [Bacteroidales bacterium]|jgi:phosphomethylpyrimidine synthase|nr:phosphomethylpyrimidine synthase ThiC [Bacteroidales bacterium]
MNFPHSFKLKTKNGFISIGKGYPIQVNCNIGTNRTNSFNREIEKINTIFQCKETSPDIMMDLSIIQNKTALSKYIIDNFEVAVGEIPYYTIFDQKKGISKNQLLEHIIEQAEYGIAFFTLHFTANLSLYDLAKKNRHIPMTSRGGSIILSDSIMNKKTDNVLIENIDELIAIALKYNIAISLGTTFRPAGIKDACDKVHILETKEQLKICRYLQERGVNVIVENIGHIDLSQLQKHSILLQKFNAPIMPLGPLPTDNAIGNDDIASAIGASFAAYFNCCHIINSITPNEHLTSSFTIEETIRGIKAAKIAAHCINILKFNECREIDNKIYESRAKKQLCLENCSRCDDFCPLKLNME